MTWSKFILMSPLWGLFSFSLFAAPIDVYIDRTSGKANLGLSDFFTKDKDVPTAVVADFQQIVEQDLTFTQLFNLIKNGPVIVRRQDSSGWLALGSDIVLAAELVKNSKNELMVKATLFDATAANELLSIQEKRSWAQSRALAHDVANRVVEYFTGKGGIFHSKIAFVNDATGRKELYLADYDGRGIRRLTNDNSIVILPRISPDGSKVVFTSYISGNPDLYLINTDGSGRKKVSGKSGLNVSPSWSPNSHELAVTLSPSGTSPNLYLIDLSGSIRQRITNTPGADTAPSFAPDGMQLSFTTDRVGAPHIFIMNLDGTGVRRVTTEGHCDSSAWSPDGQTIVYVKGSRDGFDIYSVEVLTGIERRLTWGQGDNENPAWSPDGRFIVFTSNRRKKNELFIMLFDGRDQRPLFPIKGDSFTPHWSN